MRKNNVKIIFEMISEMIFEKGCSFWGVLFHLRKVCCGEIFFVE